MWAAHRHISLLATRTAELCFVVLLLMRTRYYTFVMARIVRREPCAVHLSPSLVRNKGYQNMLHRDLVRERCLLPAIR